MKRNEFIKKAVTGTAALFAVNWAAFSQIHGSKPNEKIPLTEENLNRFFDMIIEENNTGLLDEADAGLKKAMEKYFAILPEQQRTVDKRSRSDWRKIQSMIRDLRKKKGKLRFKFLIDEKGDCGTKISLLKNDVVQNKEIIVKEVIVY